MALALSASGLLCSFWMTTCSTRIAELQHGARAALSRELLQTGFETCQRAPLLVLDDFDSKALLAQSFKEPFGVLERLRRAADGGINIC